MDWCNSYLLKNYHWIYHNLLTFSPNASKTYTYNHEKYCGKHSLDTYLYILQEKKGQINLINVEDDSSCTNPQKSSIDLLNHRDGEYIIAVGGYGQEYGNYYIQLECIQYSFPIQQKQFDPPLDNIIDITCNQTIEDQTAIFEPVQHYQLSINKNTYLPIIISTNSEEIIMYLIKHVTENKHIDYDYEIVLLSKKHKIKLLNDLLLIINKLI